MTRQLAALILLTLAVLVGGASALRAQPETTTFVIVRHAEKATEPKRDPVLSEQGIQRARKLARTLSAVDVSALYACADHSRTALTLEPMVRPGLSLHKPTDDELMATIGDLTEQHRGGVVVIASHSNVVPKLIESLSGVDVGEIDESRYDDLFILTQSGNRPASVLPLKYGRSLDEADYAEDTGGDDADGESGRRRIGAAPERREIPNRGRGRPVDGEADR